MGILSSQIGGFAGAGLGEALGKKFGGSIGQEAGKNIGRAVGTAAGAAIPYFKKGGMVHETGPAVVHKGELVVPRKYVKDVPKSIKKALKDDNKPNKLSIGRPQAGIAKPVKKAASKKGKKGGKK